jgi:hypothetical protein
VLDIIEQLPKGVRRLLEEHLSRNKHVSELKETPEELMILHVRRLSGKIEDAIEEMKPFVDSETSPINEQPIFDEANQIAATLSEDPKTNSLTISVFRCPLLLNVIARLMFFGKAFNGCELLKISQVAKYIKEGWIGVSILTRQKTRFNMNGLLDVMHCSSRKSRDNGSID